MSSEDLSGALVESYRIGLREALAIDGSDPYRADRDWVFMLALVSVLGPEAALRRFREFVDRLDIIRKEEYKAAGIGVMKKGVSRG